MWKEVIIVGAGAAGLSASACLNKLSIDNLILEKDDCSVPLWRKYSYDRLHLHLAKTFCELPHLPYPKTAPTYLSKDEFVKYIDAYVQQFDLRPVYDRCVETAVYDRAAGAWTVRAKHTRTGEAEEYRARFLVVATGENSEGYVPDVPGLDGFPGEVMHSSQYKNGVPYKDQDVLVVGSGNSGMEIALDLCNHHARASLVVRAPVHIITREVANLGLHLFKYLPYSTVDSLQVLHSKLKYGDTAKYGIVRPTEGPNHLKDTTGKYPVVDIGTFDKIKSGDIQVYPGVKCIRSSDLEFENGSTRRFDAIIFATGYKSTVKAWLKDDDGFFDESGFPAEGWPSQWKGNNGLYCVGFSRKGFYGIAEDAKNVAQDISVVLSSQSVSKPKP
ncbi:probable indole-3-pyruvate monooxygenase YUCCA10 [Nymphaea colorata]|nr:probable indole-3-pyruvate monooxygenase YUCCA10 [Nymphaea colorata]